MKFWQEYSFCLVDRAFVPTAIKVALVVGSVLFTINHSMILMQGKMTRQRWIAGGLTYLVPYCVSIHGQCVSRKATQKAHGDNK